MAVKIKDILSNKTQFPDDARFTLAGEEITFGELRRQNDESHGEIERQLDTRQQELDAQKVTQDRATNVLANVLDNVSRVTGLSYDQLVKGQIPENLRETVASVTRETRTDSGLALKDDPLYKPILDGYITPLQTDMGVVKNVLNVSINAFKNYATKLAYIDFMQSEDKPAGFKAKYEDALQTAANKGYKDENGFPDVSRALREMSGPVAAKADNEKIRQEGYEAGRKSRETEILAQLNQPTTGADGISFESTADGKPAPTKSIKEKLNEAFNDPSIVGSLFGGATVQ